MEKKFVFLCIIRVDAGLTGTKRRRSFCLHFGYSLCKLRKFIEKLFVRKFYIGFGFLFFYYIDFWKEKIALFNAEGFHLKLF